MRPGACPGILEDEDEDEDDYEKRRIKKPIFSLRENLNHPSANFVYAQLVLMAWTRTGCMKRNNVDGSEKRRVSAPRQREQLMDIAKAGDARNQFAMRAIWVILGVACAALGWVLLTILLM